MRIICIDRARGNEALVQVVTRELNTVIRVKLVPQPQGIQAIAHLEGDEENMVKVTGAGIHRAVLIYITHLFPTYKREAYAARMEWEC